VHLDVDEQDRTRVTRCLDIFENYCTVTQSVRKGIEGNREREINKTTQTQAHLNRAAKPESQWKSCEF
jgi:hypothetical protein